MATKKKIASVPFPLRTVWRFGSGKIGGLEIPPFANNLTLYHIVHHTNDTIARYWKLLCQI
jgi:hypothetical protein